MISPTLKFVALLLFIVNSFSSGATIFFNELEDRIPSDRFVSQEEILDAKRLLISLGVPEINLCRSRASVNHEHGGTKHDDLLALPLCRGPPEYIINQDAFNETIGAGGLPRMLEEEEEEEEDIELEENPLFKLAMGLCALGCIMMAALAAGLTMGMLSLDPLMLLVKVRAARSQEEKDQASALLPVVKDHHMLLVTLLLLNSMANEALPLFLEALVSPVVSVILSVTFVLIFGEILPSAIFIGPRKIEYASKMVPIVKVVMMLVWPIARPIAKLLDKFLHEENDEENINRGEFSALVRIQYEERLACKRHLKTERMGSQRGRASSFLHPKHLQPELEALLQSVKAGVKRTSSASSDNLDESVHISDTHVAIGTDSIHVDEVMMVEGALQMKTKTAMDAFTPVHRMFAVPDDLVLNEDNVVDIYSSGYSRIPVYERNPLKPKSQRAIKGILMTKQLIVVNMNEDRLLSTMPLFTPPCVSPKTNLVGLVNLFQTGRVGHFALVCARPQIGDKSLKEGNVIPEKAGLMGIITLEDVLEELLQEEIYDENDNMEKAGEIIARWVAKKLKKQTSSKKSSVTNGVETLEPEFKNESTALLGTN